MRIFNEALLAKQVWILIKQPNSLLTNCLKAKYFPHTDVLKSRRGHNPNFVWSSIYHAKSVIQKGGCWKIGDGCKVNVWEDNWLPQNNGFKLYTPHNNSSTINQAKDLMITEPKGWHQSLLNTHFLSFESEHINQLPLIQEELEDSFMWMYTKDGN